MNENNLLIIFCLISHLIIPKKLLLKYCENKWRKNDLLNNKQLIKDKSDNILSKSYENDEVS